MAMGVKLFVWRPDDAKTNEGEAEDDAAAAAAAVKHALAEGRMYRGLLVPLESGRLCSLRVGRRSRARRGRLLPTRLLHAKPTRFTQTVRHFTQTLVQMHLDTFRCMLPFRMCCILMTSNFEVVWGVDCGVITRSQS